MKTKITKRLFLLGFLFFLIACSTRKNTFLSRNSHALSTKYNILYNGDLALEQGLLELKTQYQDNFWELLPVERMQIKEEQLLPNENRNPNFERAEEKATKAIQKHSMNIQGSEKNPQMDEAHLLLGKARYYDQRFVPALEAFNYVLYKYPKSSKIYEVKIWREKTNMRLENDQLAVNNLRKLLKEIKFKDQIFADANAVLAQAFLNLEEKDSAVAKLKLAREFTKSNEEKSRYHFILGQLYEKLGYKDSAFASYQEVIDMNRRAARQYVIHAHINQTRQNEFKKGDTIAFLKKWNHLIDDRENRPFLDALYHQKAKFYESQENFAKAKENYNLSLKKKSQDQYLVASNYRNLATIYFNDAKYPTAGKYYDSTLVYLKPRTREFNAIKKKRENLEDVIKYEAIAQKNDSIISLYKMSASEKVAYYEKYIDKLKIADAKQQKELEKQAQIKANSETFGEDKLDGQTGVKSTIEKPTTNFLSGAKSNFYFYNPTTIAYGKKEFTKIWGKRKLVDNWRFSSQLSKDNSSDIDEKDSKENDIAESKGKEDSSENPAYNPDFYISQLPTSQTVIDSLSKERNFAYYQLGVIYKEKFKEYQLAVNKLEQLLKNNPEERLILPSMYNLYKLYEILDKNKALAMKARIIAEYPDSRYAQILSNPQDQFAEDSDSPKAVYEALFKQYQEGNFKEVLVKTDLAIDRFTGEEIVPKLELLKANLVGKLNGLDEYQQALNYVALNYPNVEEGKTAEKKINVSLPKLQALQLGKYESTNWKILYQSKDFDDKNTKNLREKIAKFIKDRGLEKLTISLDIYTMTDNFVVIHGMKSEDYAKTIASFLKEFKEYKIPDVPIIISTENYTVAQIKKNLDDYLAGKLVDNPQAPNWDGTLEKAPVTQQEEPKQENPKGKQQVNQQSLDAKKGAKAEENQNSFGPPPSPQMPPTEKKR
ncbi:type IX secretion system periplasmic lipoprotein PorW/SprE [Flavobacterium capsici]|uniref:Gliding motility protein n=1 Tax=Flavobacterium capsici TaxID=3075618 RepID=A0AA96EZA5_9FLAO|nr:MULTISPECIES: gliding motility protein [unclassified Flavobacterium]WNM19690.1 gliding motility protein [Flavobacterium sp. PMR2A8]WNM21079.1 gliding motility protein [Flavobacterium sp. PMTSA4]